MKTTLTPPRGGLAVAVLAFFFVLGAVDAQAQTKRLTFDMPACPIKAKTVPPPPAIPPAKTAFPIPSADPLSASLDVTGTIQIADQSGGVISKTTVDDFRVLPTEIYFARTINTLAHITGSVSFDHGCSATDPYGSTKCTWNYNDDDDNNDVNDINDNDNDKVVMAYQGVLQEDVQAGKLVVDLKINNVIPFSFSCPICGATCTLAAPAPFDQAELWHLFFSLYPFAPFLISVPSPPAAPMLAESFTPSTIAASGTSTLAFTVTNPNPVPPPTEPVRQLTNIGFTDSLPSGLLVSTPNGLSGSCGGGTIAATAGGSSVSLIGATLDPGATCAFSIDVTSSETGNYVNTTGAVTANESFTGLTAIASLNVTPFLTVPTLSKWGLLLLCILLVYGYARRLQ